MADTLPKALQRAVAGDHTLILRLAAEACLSERSVARCLAGVDVRPNTRIAIVRAWGRLQRDAGPRESRLVDASTSPKESRLADAQPASRLEDAPKSKKPKGPKKGSRLTSR